MSIYIFWKKKTNNNKKFDRGKKNIGVAVGREDEETLWSRVERKL